jgi:putative CocE/NonD family hydrolase
VAACAAFVLFALPAGAAAKPAERWTGYARPATHEVVRDANVPIEMSDGVVLRAHVDRPDAPGRFPTLIVQTPYNKDAGIGAFLAGSSRFFVTRGYAVVTVDVRGTGSSGGQWDSFGNAEQRDGPEVVEWAAEQPWSTGKVGLTGPSYMALNQLLTAARRPPHLEAIFPIVPMADGYRDIVFSGGSTNVSFIPFWLGLVTVGSLTPAPQAENPLETLSVLLQHANAVLDFDLPSVLSAATGGEIAYDGPFWKTRSPLEVVDRIRVPAFVVGGLHDLFQRGTPLIYERLKRHVPARLLMGPWNHIEGSTGAGLPADGVPALNSIALRWFDRWLLGRRTRIGRIPRVTQYVWGRERYVTQHDWPDPRLDPKRLYLRGDAGLAAGAPREAEPTQSFFQDPLTGICTLSTEQWTVGLADPIPCVSDRTDDERGVAGYATAPLRRRLELSGPILANLWVETTAADAVATVRVKDVAPNGEVTELTNGWLTGSFRAVDPARSRYLRDRRRDGSARGPLRLLQPWHPFTRASVLPVRAGEPVRMPIEIFPTRATIRPGHRLKLTVSGGDFPHQLPPLPRFAGSLAGRVSVLNEPGHASFLELPSLARRCNPCAPLPVAPLVRGR